MHPSPSALIEMSDADLNTYRDSLRIQAIDTDEDFNGPCRARIELIDGILADRKRGPREAPEAVYTVKFHNGAHGVQRTNSEAAYEAAIERRPARVYRVGAPNVLLATVHDDGGIDFTPEGAAEQRLAKLAGELIAVLILNTTQHKRTALVVAPFGDDGAMHFTPLTGDKPGDSFILDAIAVRELAAFVTPEVDDHA